MDRLADVLYIIQAQSVYRGHPEGGVEPVGVACLRKELSCFGRVVGVVLDVVVVAEHVRRHPVLRDVCGLLVQSDDRGLVDRVVDRLSYLSAREWFEVPGCLFPGLTRVAFAVAVSVVVPVPVVHGEVPDAHAWSDLEREVLVCLDDVIGRGVRVLHPLYGVVL